MIRNLYPILLAGIFAALSLSLSGQDREVDSFLPGSYVDTAAARQLMQMGTTFLENQDRDSAIRYFSLAADMYKGSQSADGPPQLPGKYLHSVNQQGRCHLETGDYPLCITTLTEVLTKDTLYLPENHPEIAHSISLLGHCFAGLREFSKALQHHEEALGILMDTFGVEHPQVANAYENIGLVYIDQGDFANAEASLQKALVIKISTLGETHSEVADLYNNLGIIYDQTGAFDKALTTHQKALSLRMNSIKPDHPLIANHLTNIGVVYEYQGQRQKALTYYQNALEIYTANYGEYHHLVSNIYNNIGTVYLELSEYEKAILTLRKALSIGMKTVGEAHPDIAKYYTNIGLVYQKQQKYDLAFQHYQKALIIRFSLNGEKHPDLSELYLNMGTLNWEHGLYPEALDCFQKGLLANSMVFQSSDLRENPSPDIPVFSKRTLLRVLRAKAFTFFNLYAVPPYLTEDLIISHLTYKEAANWVDEIRQTYDHSSDKGTLLNEVFEIYEGAISTSLELFKVTKADSFLRQAFQYFEKSRSILMLEDLHNTKAKSFAGIPDSLLQREREITGMIAQHEKNLFQEKLKRSPSNASWIKQHEELVFDLKQQKELLNAYLEAEYPEYFRLKYDINVSSVEEVQSGLSGKESGLIEYFIGDSAIYVYFISPDAFDLISVPRDFPLNKWVAELQSSIYTYYLTGNFSEAAYTAYSDTLVRRAHDLYQKLLLPIEQKHGLPPMLTIIPDGILGYLSFDLLLTQLPENPARFNSHPYLIRDLQISYSYSATLLREMREKQHKKPPSNQLLAVAPSFSPKRYAGSRYIGSNKYILPPLFYNVPEAQALKELMKGDVLTDSLATEDQFIRLAPDYRILHLATHGKANDKAGDYSFLAFAEIKDSIENEFLYTRDLYSLQLNADMVVLSACETGIGELQRGEGIISLARGFSYAGAKSIITTLWSINDLTTMELMKDFYGHILDGMPKDAALRQAKLGFLENHSDKLSHPFFWGALVAIGDMEPVRIEKAFNWRIPGLLLVLLSFIGVFLKLKKLPPFA